MTTNVYDNNAALLTSDSRWSREMGDWVAYVDDTNYDKIVHDNKLAFLFAGELPEINRWKEWILGGRKKDARPILYDTKMSVIQIDVADGKIVFKSHLFKNTSFGAATKALFAGTGAEPAKECWDVNKCAKTAIVSAAKKDYLSGGYVVFFNRKSRQGNVTNTATASGLQDQLKERGILMNTKTQTSMSIKDAANDTTNTTAQALATAVMSGSINLNAPFPGMDTPWSEQKKTEFEAALALYDEE